MTYDEDLAFRLMGATMGVEGLTTKSMFGGIAFLKDGHIAIAASGKGGLMVRVDPQDAPALLGEAGVSPMVMGGRETAGWLRVTAEAVEREADLQAWIDRGLAVVSTLPPQ